MGQYFIQKMFFMNFLHRALLQMGLFLGIFMISGGLLFQTLLDVFQHNLILNCLIFGVFLLGVCLSFFQIYRLRQENTWLDIYDQGKTGFPGTPKPNILTPLAILLTDRNQPSNISPLAAKTILTSIEGRLDDQRDLTRYIVGLLIFLGLVGTFWGLSKTIGAIAGVIHGIDVNAAEIQDAFKNLKTGLQTPLTGMGYAFSSSLFGLVGSLIVGFFDMLIAKVHTRFYQNLEERLAFSTRLSPQDSDTPGAATAYTSSLVEQSAETMSNLLTQINRSEESRISMMKSIHNLTEKMSITMDAMQAQQSIVQQLSHSQVEIQHAISVLTQVQDAQKGDTTKKAILSIDATAQRLLDEIKEGRALTVSELQKEIRLVAKTLSAIANGQDVAET